MQYLLPLALNKYLFSRLLRSVQTIVLEGDMPIGAPDCAENCVDYALYVSKLGDAGFAVRDARSCFICCSFSHRVR